MNEPSPWSDPPAYTSPYADSGARPPAPPQAVPTFCKVMFIIDLVLTGIRALMVPLSLLGIIAMETSDPLMTSAYFEVAYGVIIVLIAIPASIMGLMGKPLALHLGWANVGVSLLGIGLTLWQTTLSIGEPNPLTGQVAQPGSPEMIGFWIGAVLTIGIRLALVGLLAFAVMRYSKWIRDRGY